MREHVDLFSGLGCWSIAAQTCGVRTVALCEREEWLAKGLERIWKVPVCRDVKEFPTKEYEGVWLLTASPPCQPVSCAGKRGGHKDARWLWPETLAVCEVVQPAWFVCENPPGIDGLGLDGILAQMERLGYEVQPLRIPACAVNSPQDRDRFWIVGNRLGSEWEQRLSNREIARTAKGSVAGSVVSAAPGRQGNKPTLLQGGSLGDPAECAQAGTLANGAASQPDGAGKRMSGAWRSQLGPGSDPWGDFEWLPFNDSIYRLPPGFHELADGCAARIPKRFRGRLISALGNAIVPQIAQRLIQAMIQSEL